VLWGAQRPPARFTQELLPASLRAKAASLVLSTSEVESPQFKNKYNHVFK
jgi:hypothetical protein